MTGKIQGVLVLALFGGLGCGAGPSSETDSRAGEGTRATTLKIESPAFAAGAAIPRRHTCDGADLSPPLTWSGVPASAAGLVLIMDDPGAPAGTWVHWVLYDLPPNAPGLAEGVPRTERLDNGAAQGACWGVTSFERLGYYGPCPPPGAPHRYEFKLYAVDRKLGLPPGATKGDVLKEMKGHVLAEGRWTGKYAR